jgi:hypothetical protein
MDGAVMAEMLDRVVRVCTGEGTFREARACSGLSLGQVEMLTGILRGRVLAIEDDGGCSAQEWEMLRVAYGVDGFTRERPEGDAGAVTQCPYCACVYTLASTSMWVPSGERHRDQCGLLRQLRERGGVR